MAQILKLRRSAIAGAKPNTSQIEFGEVAMNTADGKLFMKISGSTGVSVIEIGSNTANGSITGSSYYIPVFSGSAALVTSSIYQSGSFTSISGSLTVTNGITGSLFGTASWAQNAITASYIQASGVVGLNLSQISTGSVTASVNTGTNIFNIVSGSNTLVVVDNAGSMGIGTTSPGGYKLDVNGTLRSGVLTFRVNQGTIYYSSTVYIQLPLQGGPTGGIFADGGYGWAYNNGAHVPS